MFERGALILTPVAASYFAPIVFKREASTLIAVRIPRRRGYRMLFDYGRAV